MVSVVQGPVIIREERWKATSSEPSHVAQKAANFECKTESELGWIQLTRTMNSQLPVRVWAICKKSLRSLKRRSGGRMATLQLIKQLFNSRLFCCIETSICSRQGFWDHECRISAARNEMSFEVSVVLRAQLLNVPTSPVRATSIDLQRTINYRND